MRLLFRLLSTSIIALIAGAIGAWLLITFGGNLGLTGQGSGSSGSSVFESLTRTVQEESGTVDVVESATPAVVSIVITQEVSTSTTTNSNSFFGDFFFEDIFQEPSESEESSSQTIEVGSGSGFIVSEDGLIVTNRHVVNEDDVTYTVYLNNGDSYEATVIDRDLTTDLAIMDIDAEGLPALELGDSDALQVGQSVIAIGNTLGEYENTVTKGIVSGLARDLGAQYSGLIQTDAAINEGNSGGPLLNLSGQVIGINTAVDRSGEGIGFAIPINQALVAIESVKEEGRIIRPGLGIRYIPINAEIAEINNLANDFGAYIRGGQNDSLFGVIPGSPAEEAGLLEGDIILEVDGQRIDEENPLSNMVTRYSIGDIVELRVLRKEEELTISVTLDELNP